MKKLIAVMASTAALTLGTLAGGATIGAASADTPNCADKAEFKKVRNGMSKDRVKGIFDVGGQQSYVFTSGGVRYEGREYKTCYRFGYIAVDFERGKVVGKTRF